jgi:hypothetical protein
MKRMTTTRYPAGSRLTPLFALLALLVGATAVPAEAIDLETAVALALQSNLGIDSELAAVRQKKLIADTWWNRFYPSANANYTLGRLNVEPTSAVPGVPASPQWFMSAGVDLNLVLTLQMIPGISLSRLDYENGLIGLAEARAQVERDVSRQFYQLLLLQDRIELQRQQIANAERRYSQAQSNYDNGLIDEYTLLSSRVSLENLRPALAGLEVGYQQALLGFRNSLGLPLTAEVTPIGEIDPPEINLAASAVTQQHLRGRFDIQQLEMLDRILREQRRVTDFNPQGGRAPYFRFGWSVDPTFQGDPSRESGWTLTDGSSAAAPSPYLSSSLSMAGCPSVRPATRYRSSTPRFTRTSSASSRPSGVRRSTCGYSCSRSTPDGRPLPPSSRTSTSPGERTSLPRSATTTD